VFERGKLFLFGSLALWALTAAIQTVSAASELSTIATPASLTTLRKTLKSAIEEDRQIVSRCNADLEQCSSSTARRFNAIVEEGSAYEGLSRIGHINRAVNYSIRVTNNRSPEKWSTPLTALARGAGDCKQFAIVKYAALSAAGYGADDLRILIVEDKTLYRPHAVVAVRDRARWLILNNRSLAIVELKDFLNYYRFLGMLGPDNFVDFAQQGDPIDWGYRMNDSYGGQ
jgi:predicted transglutaminase-like cysteine proteinase